MDMQTKSLARSCTTCAKAKAKCVRKPDQNICERCFRLKKECYLKEPTIRKKKQPVKATRAAQLQKLENKIETLVNALSTQGSGQQSEYGHPSPPVSHTSPAEKPISRTAEVLNSLSLRSETLEAIPGAGETASVERSLPAAPFTASCPVISLNEAQLLLDRYQRSMAPGFPFVVIPAGTSVRVLAEHRPVLLRAITTVAMIHDLPRQEALVSDFIREIADRILVKSQKSLDIMQGIIVFISWYYPHVFWSSQTTNLLHLAVAQTIDLGLDRPPQLCPDFKSVTARAVHGPALVGRGPNLAEQRALLGTFYLTSVLACCLKKVDPMPPTRYMEECARNLQRAGEYESDRLLVQSFRMQTISNSIHTTNNQSAPMAGYVRAYIADIERVRRSSLWKEENCILRLQDLAAEVNVWALSLNDLHEHKGRQLSAHLEDLYRCMKAGKAFMEVYLAIPPSTYLVLPFSVFGYFAQVLIIIIKLASLEMDGWDIKAVTNELGFLQFCDQAAYHFEQATQTSIDGINVNNEAFKKWAGKVRWMKSVYSAKFANETGENLATAPPLPASSNAKNAMPAPATAKYCQPTPPDDLMNSEFFSVMDENFWNNFATDFDMGFAEQQGV